MSPFLSSFYPSFLKPLGIIYKKWKIFSWKSKNDLLNLIFSKITLMIPQYKQMLNASFLPLSPTQKRTLSLRNWFHANREMPRERLGVELLCYSCSLICGDIVQKWPIRNTWATKIANIICQSLLYMVRIYEKFFFWVVNYWGSFNNLFAHGILYGCINAVFIFPSRHIHLVKDYFYIDRLWWLEVSKGVCIHNKYWSF